MCLIAFSPKGELMPRDAFEYAERQNNDGIGIMSQRGVEKFLGKKARKRAWRYLSDLAAEKIPYGIHFRWATHGDVVQYLCHPFKTKEGHLVMHNGVISEAAKVSDELNAKAKVEYTSDTSVFAKYYLDKVPNADATNYDEYFDKVEKFIGWGNKLLVLHDGNFTICNEHAGDWIKGFWYSNTYSLPAHMNPRAYTYKGTQNWRDYADSDYLPRPASSAANAVSLANYYRERENENAEGFYDEGHGTDAAPDLTDCGACGQVHSRTFACGGELKELELEPTQEDEDLAEANAIAYLNGSAPSAADTAWQRQLREANDHLNDQHPAVSAPVAPTVIPAATDNGTTGGKLSRFQSFKALVRAKAMTVR